MNKENEYPWPCTRTATEDEALTPEQRARISRNFKTAKALLSRKRPRFLPPLPPSAPDKLDNRHSTSVPTRERVPLKDIQINPGSQSTSRGSDHRDNKYVIAPLTTCRSIGKIFHSPTTRDSSGQQIDVRRNNGSSFTPINSRGRLFDSGGGNQCSTVPSVLDDVFDDTVLEEIDSLCKGRTVGVLQRNINTGQNDTHRSETNDDSISNKGRLFDSGGANQCSTVPSVLDDVFDNTVLEEIDSLCKGRTVDLLQRKINTGQNDTHRSETDDDSISNKGRLFDSGDANQCSTVPSVIDDVFDDTVLEEIDSVCKGRTVDGLQTGQNDTHNGETNDDSISNKGRLFDSGGANQCSTVSSVLDDVFDNTVLEEIDSLCKGRTVDGLQRKVNTGQNDTHRSETNDDSISNKGRLFDSGGANQCSTVPSVLDDVFDNTVLEEIDSLCKGRTVDLLQRKINTGQNDTHRSETDDDSISNKGRLFDSGDANQCSTVPSVIDDVFDDTVLEEIDSVCKGRTVDGLQTGQNDTHNGETNDDSISNKGRLFDSGGANQCSTVSSVLDDVFDNTVLEEIDSLCKGRTVDGLQRKVNTGQNDTHKSETNDDSISCKKLSSHEVFENPRGDQENASLSHTSHVNITHGNEFQGMPETYSKYMESLNQEQLEAASTDPSKPLMVVAGPGSGKTSTMVGRVLMLLNQDIGPSNILAMTFTTAAASEMRERIANVAGKEIAKALTISTFHSFSLQLCRAHAEKLSRTSDFIIYGHGQQRRAVVEAIRLLDCEKDTQKLAGSETSGLTDDTKLHSFKDKSQKWQKFVTQAKASGKTSEVCREKGDEFGARILSNYNDILRSCNALDYHDLISCSVKLLTDFPEVFSECQELWRAVIVDEFQDTSAMQYSLLRLLASHGQITVVGDDDQSIFSFNGANICGFDFFRKDFPNHKEVRLRTNYRSTRCIVEAAASLIQHNIKRCKSKEVHTDNSSGSKIALKECHNEDAQCAYVVDKILEIVKNSSETRCSFGNVAILYRRQVSGRAFQATFRDRRIPFNVHGVAFYRKKVTKAIMAMVKTTLPGCDDNSYRHVFKTLLPYEKEENKRVIEHIDKISTIRKCSFISAASDIFNAKISGTFKRSQLSQGRKVLATLDMISKLVCREHSISSVVTSIANLVPQKYLLEQRAVVNCDGGKLLNEDNDLRSVLEYLLNDVTDFLSSQFVSIQTDSDNKGCTEVLKAFVDYVSEREKENFRSRRHDNEDSVTLTTIHQSKGLEWDIVFIVKANESEIPLLHEHNGITKETGNSIEEERRLFYVAMTRARKKLLISYVMMDSNWQMLHPSRFVREIPSHLLEVQGDMNPIGDNKPPCKIQYEAVAVHDATMGSNFLDNKLDAASEELIDIEFCSGNTFLKRFTVGDRGQVSRIFHQWAKKKAFQNPKRLLDKISFVIDERLRSKNGNSKDILSALKSSLKCDEALWFAEYVIKWEQIPADKRVHMIREKQEHFQKLRMENAMGSSTPTSKQIGYLHSLGCTVVPESKLHASRLIEQYKSI